MIILIFLGIVIFLIVGYFIMLGIGGFAALGLVASDQKKRTTAESRTPEVLDAIFDGTSTVVVHTRANTLKPETVIVGARQRDYELISDAQDSQYGESRTLIFAAGPQHASAGDRSSQKTVTASPDQLQLPPVPGDGSSRRFKMKPWHWVVLSIIVLLVLQITKCSAAMKEAASPDDAIASCKTQILLMSLDDEGNAEDLKVSGIQSEEAVIPMEEYPRTWLISGSLSSAEFSGITGPATFTCRVGVDSSGEAQKTEVEVNE